MNQNEQTRLKVLNSVMVGQLPVAQAAELLGVCERHVWRVLAAYRREGAAALVHGNRGRRPANATSEAAIADVLRLATTRYSGTNHTHLSELLMEREGIALSRSAVRRIALSAGVTSPRRRRSPRHRVRRKRMPQAGMLVQIDGSHHRWLEGRGPSFALLLAVDDATSTAPYALFQAEEDARGYLMLMEGLIQRHGIPLAVYSDRHAVFKHPGEPRQKLPEPTQFARAMQQLGIRQIFARSPQAKGRVERTAGTFQDRLVTELRLARVETMDQANEILHRYLPRFDRQFGVPAAQSEVAYRPPETAAAVEQALCFRYRRKVAKDNTVKYRWRTLQQLSDQERPSYAGVRVEVLERPDGRLLVEYKGRMIPTQEAPHVPASCVCSVRLPASTVAPMARATITTRSQLSNRAASTTPNRTVPAERASMQLRCLGSQPRAKWHCGRRYRRPRSVACPSVGLRGSWVSIGTPPASTRQPRGRP